MDADKGIVVARAFEPLSKAVVKQIAELGITEIRSWTPPWTRGSSSSA